MLHSSFSKNGKTEFVAIPEAFKVDLEFIRDLDPNQLIFESKVNPGKMIGVNTMTTRHLNILKDLNYTPGVYSLYSWKHTGAVMAVKNKVSLKHLQIQLRHHSLDQVDQYLRQLGVNDLNDLVNKFPEI